MSQLRILLLGAPGAGKGTQAKLLCEKNSLAHISTGDILRSAVAEQSELGKKAQGFMDQGELVPDSLMIDLIRERLQKEDGGFLLDGFPRTVDQSSALTTLLEEIDRPITHIINVIVSDEELLSRIEQRGLESGRSDDNREVAQNRLEVYNKQTAPVVAYYQENSEALGIEVAEVDGLSTVEEVSARIAALLS